MRIYVINVRKSLTLLSFALILVALLVSAAYIFSYINEGARDVFSADRELPIYSVDYADKVASITFDCAWGADDIPDIINTLKKADIKATFFMVGQWAEKFPDMVKLISREGHDVANHSYTHLRMGAIDTNKMNYEISMCGKVLEGISGSKVDLFRAPYGDYNDNVIKTAKRLGYYTIQWDVDSLDWKPGISRDEIMDRIKRRIAPGSIILFHNDTPHTAKILPEIISVLKKEGYSFLPVSKLIMRENYEMDYEGRQKRKN